MSNATVETKQDRALARQVEPNVTIILTRKADGRLFDDFRWVCRALCKDAARWQSLGRVHVDENWISATDGRRLHRVVNTCGKGKSAFIPFPHGHYRVAKNTQQRIELDRIGDIWCRDYPNLDVVLPKNTDAHAVRKFQRKGSQKSVRGGYVGLVVADLQRIFQEAPFGIDVEYVSEALTYEDVGLVDVCLVRDKKSGGYDPHSPVRFEGARHRAIICPVRAS